MKRYFLLAAAAIGMMAACSKTEVQPASKIDDSTLEAVKFNRVNAPKFDVLTRGAGAVEAWNSQALYILGYQRNPGDYTKDGITLIPNVKVDAPMIGTSSNLLTVEQNTAPAGSPEYLEPYYYGDSEVYDFFGYYVDDAKGEREDDNVTPKLAKTSAGISWELTIDGTQDIMAAKADPIEDVIGKGVSAKEAYSAYAARRDVQPTLNFNHLLARFNFYVVAGQESGKTTYVTGIRMNSKTLATLNLAPEISLTSTETLPTDTTKFLTLMQEPTTAGDPLEKLVPKFPYSNADYSYTYEEVVTNNSATSKIGESIMAIAGEEMHKVIIHTKYDGSKLKRNPVIVELDAKKIVGKDGKTAGITAFEAGYQYDIILTIYGPEKVEITAVLSDWKDGGHQLIDPDAGRFAINDSFLVKDESSYNLLPESYRTEHGDWGTDGLNESLPWLAVVFTPVESFEVTLTNKDNGFTVTKTYGPVALDPTPENPTPGNKQLTLLTLNLEELNEGLAADKQLTSLKGTWIIEINDNYERIVVE